MLGVSFSLTCHMFYLLNILQSVHFSSTVDFHPNPITFYWRLSNGLPDNLPVPGQVLFSIRVSYLKCQCGSIILLLKTARWLCIPSRIWTRLLVWDGDLFRTWPLGMSILDPCLTLPSAPALLTHTYFPVHVIFFRALLQVLFLQQAFPDGPLSSG